MLKVVIAIHRLLILTVPHSTLASFPGPHPASRRLQYDTASDRNLGGGVGTRLILHIQLHIPQSRAQTACTSQREQSGEQIQNFRGPLPKCGKAQ